MNEFCVWLIAAVIDVRPRCTIARCYLYILRRRLFCRFYPFVFFMVFAWIKWWRRWWFVCRYFAVFVCLTPGLWPSRPSGYIHVPQSAPVLHGDAGKSRASSDPTSGVDSAARRSGSFSSGRRCPQPVMVTGVMAATRPRCLDDRHRRRTVDA